MALSRLRLASSFPFITALTLGAFAGCASSTVIQSQPPDARVLINGMAVGNTPYTLADTKIVGSTTQLRLEYPGYQPLDVTLVRNEQLDVAALIFGILLLVPLLWVMAYQPMHIYQLQPAGAWRGSPARRVVSAARRCRISPPAGYPPPPPAGYPPPPPVIRRLLPAIHRRANSDLSAAAPVAICGGGGPGSVLVARRLAPRHPPQTIRHKGALPPLGRGPSERDAKPVVTGANPSRRVTIA